MTKGRAMTKSCKVCATEKLPPDGHWIIVPDGPDAGRYCNECSPFVVIRRAAAEMPGPTCEHRAWQEDDKIIGSGPICGKPAEWLACYPFNQPVCLEHRCRCQKPLKRG